MSDPSEMSTLSGVMKKLAEKGYDQELRITRQGGELQSSGEVFKPKDLLIVRIFRFEGISDPADMSVLYAVEMAGGNRSDERRVWKEGVSSCRSRRSHYL